MLQVVKVWRDDLSKINAKAAESLADPAQYPNLFPNYDLALHAEQYQVRFLLLQAIRHQALVLLGGTFITVPSQHGPRPPCHYHVILPLSKAIMIRHPAS